MVDQPVRVHRIIDFYFDPLVLVSMLSLAHPIFDDQNSLGDGSLLPLHHLPEGSAVAPSTL